MLLSAVYLNRIYFLFIYVCVKHTICFGITTAIKRVT